MSIYNLPDFRREKDSVKQLRILDHDEEEQLFAAIRQRSEDAFRLSVFLVDTGCHSSEALGLTWDDVQCGRARFCMTQTTRARTIPLTKRASEAVENAGRSSRTPFSKLCGASFLQIWDEARVEIGLNADDQVVPEALRHTCASRLVQGGIDLRRVQLWLGHKTLADTMRYACFATNDLDSCVDVLEHDRV